MKNLFYPLLFATALVSAACSNDLENDANVTDPSNKTAISFVGQNNTTTRYGFTANTQIAMHIRSTKDDSNIRETRTWATALKDKAETQSADTYSEIQAPADENVRYWDDAYGRSANLSVFAIAVPGKSDITNGADGKTLIDHLTKATSGTWNADSLSENITWTVSTNQTSDIIDNEDITYSHNISKDGEGGVVSSNHPTEKNGYLKFRLTDKDQKDGPGKFDQGNLKFYHALSRITINLFKGTGYDSNSPFQFAKGTNVKILGVPTTGTLNVESGAWSSSDSTGIETMAAITNDSGADFSFLAQVLPGYTIKSGVTTNVLEFIIDDNKYFITQDMMLDALNKGQGTSETSITMAQGKNYVFKITIGKSKIINVTATLEPFANVEAANKDMDNSHISLNLFTSNGEASTNFDLYRLNDKSDEINTGASESKKWGGNYTDKAGLTPGTNNVWTTDWFFENNKAFYHFRTVNSGITIKNADNTEDDYFYITSGDQTSHDYHWGAPFIKSTTSPILYNKANGYALFLSPAIGATNSTISMTELHMMSNINVVLRTTTGSNAVKLEDGNNQCVVTLTHFYKDGKVYMGNGLVETTGDLNDGTNGVFDKPATGTEADGADYTKTKPFTFAVVPQALKREGTGDIYVGITIKTPDDNQYYVVEKLADIIATANGGSQNQTKDDIIDFWYPNHSYTYTFTLTKAGIKSVTCTVEKWVNVTADNKDITLED